LTSLVTVKLELDPIEAQFNIQIGVYLKVLKYHVLALTIH